MWQWFILCTYIMVVTAFVEICMVVSSEYPRAQFACILWHLMIISQTAAHITALLIQTHTALPSLSKEVLLLSMTCWMQGCRMKINRATFLLKPRTSSPGATLNPTKVQCLIPAAREAFLFSRACVLFLHISCSFILTFSLRLGKKHPNYYASKQICNKIYPVSVNRCKHFNLLSGCDP